MNTNQITPLAMNVNVIANSPPVLDTAPSPALPTIAVNSGAPSGQVGATVTSLLGTAVTDPDGGAAGIAVTGVANGGTLYYSLDNGGTWMALTGTVSASSALLLGPDARVYYAPAANFTGTVAQAISFKAWDQSEGAIGDTGASTLSGTTLVGETALGAAGGSRRGTDIELIGDRAYVADGVAGLQVVDISNPAAPTVIGTYDTTGEAVAMAVVGNYVYVADGYMPTGITIVNVATPTAPSLVGTYAASLYPSYIAVRGDYAYLTGNGGLLEVVKIQNAANPVQSAFLPNTGFGPSAIAVAGDYVYVGKGGTLIPINVSNPAAPVASPALTVGGSGVVDILIENGIAYVAAASQLSIVDISNPGQPTVLSTWSQTNVSVSDLAKEGNKLYIASYDKGVTVLDVSNTAAPVYAATYETTSASSVAVKDGIVYTSLQGTAKLSGYTLTEKTAFSAATETVSAAAAPLHPVLTEDAGALAFTENDVAAAVAPTLVLTDINSDKVASVKVTFGSNPSGLTAAESLSFTASAATGDITGSYDAQDGLVLNSASGNATLAQWQAALRTVAYSNTSDTPVASRTVHFTATDAGGEGVGEATRTIAITAVNDAPTFGGVPTDTKAVTVGASTALAITVADPDSATLTLTLTATHGTIEGLDDEDLNVEGIQLSGSAVRINEALAQATFTMPAAGEGSIALTLRDGSVLAPTLATYQFNASVPVVNVPTTSIDGVAVQIGTGSNGLQQVTVPIVTAGRTEDGSTANSKLADIPLVKDAAGNGLLTVGTPVGTGFTATGPAGTVSSSDAQSLLANLISTIQGSTQQRDAAQNFVGSLPGNTQIIVQTITPVSQTIGNGPLAISVGTPQDNVKSALVIDSSGLPANSTIKLDNVDFAALIGAVRATGGAGANTVWGDGASQFVVLGADDDVLHGGGGNDTVGSLRGDDQAFGDDGDDVVYGGTGNDVLHGGNGNDRINGGFGLDRAVQTGVLADYAVTVDGHTVVLTHTTSGAVDRFTDVEVIAFDSGTSLIVAHESADVASLQAQFVGAQLIELNATRAVTGSASNDDITPTFGMALNIDLGAGNDIVRIAGARADVHIDVEAGQRAELTRLADGAMLALNNVELLSFTNGDVTVLAHNRAEAVIGRAYELLLDRNVDTGGYAFWVGGIANGASLAGTLNAIMQSPEFTGASASNSAFLDLLYTAGFDRAADAAGKAFWLAALDSGVSRAQVVESFAMSNEAVSVIGSTIDVTVVA